MPDEIDRKIVDKRVVQRYLKKGRLDDKDYDKYVKSLPDLAEQAVPIESAFDDDLDEDLEEEEPGQVGEGEKQP